MSVEILATRYAKAFLNTLKTADEYTVAIVELKRIDSLIGSNKELRDALFLPSLPTNKKADIFRAIFKIAKPSERVERFCIAIIERGRVIVYGEIVKAVEREWERRQKIVEVEIRSAVLIRSTQRQKLEAELARITGSKLKPVYKLDDSIVAGVVARIGTTYYDGSLKGQLHRIRHTLAR